MITYERPPETATGLRLHQNENTKGCSPRVLAALASITAERLGCYPPYQAATDACARHFNVEPENLILTNGLDAGILAATVAHLRTASAGSVPEAIIPEPAFEIFEINVAVAGGRAVHVAPRPDFSFAVDAVVGAITANTRLVFVTNPNNPTGVPVSHSNIRSIARRVPEEALVLVDEAYVDFSGQSFIPELDAFPNVVVGRTFSKAFGLAGLRVGVLVGGRAVLEPIRRALPVYNVNIAAVVAIQAALQDLDYIEQYVEQVNQSRTMLYEACDRLGLAYWRSAANFVLVKTGDHTAALARAAAAAGLSIRSRFKQPGCEGCIRVTTGYVEDTRRFVAVMEEALRDPTPDS